jgi:MFS family permease
MTMDSRTRWFALIVLCLGTLMIVLDTTIVNVALPSIRADLGFSQTSLAWVVNAYLLTFAGFLLLGGRLGDLYGHRRLFISGIALFTLASLCCGLATTQGFLEAARAVQGVGGAVASAVAGALAVTASLMLAVYAIVNGNQYGWTSARTTGLLGAALLFLALFLWIESRVSSPLMPLRLFRLRNVATANVVGVLWAAAMFAWFFLSALYLQLVLGYSPLQVGLAFLPANLIMGALSVGVSAKLVMRFGFQRPLATGLLFAAAGLALFARAPVGGSFLVDVLPSMILLGIGAGIAFTPVLLAAMSDVTPEESGLASGLVNTAFMMGGALGLAVLASIAASRTDDLRVSGHSHLQALVGGYHAAFIGGALFAAAAATIGATLLRTRAHVAEPDHGQQTVARASS